MRYELYEDALVPGRPWLIECDGRIVFTMVEGDFHFARETCDRLNDPSLIGDES